MSMTIFMLNKISFPVPLLPPASFLKHQESPAQVLKGLAVEMGIISSEGSSFRQGY